MGLFDFLSDDSGGTTFRPTEVVQHPEYSFTYPRLSETSDFISSNIQRMNEGQFPAYYQKAQPVLRESMQRPLYESYYGRPGSRTGIIQAQQESGAISGLGPKQTSANVNKALLEMSNRERAIDEYLTQLGVNIMQEDAYRFPALSISMPRGPEVTVIPGSSVQTGGGNFLGDLASAALAMYGMVTGNPVAKTGGVSGLMGQTGSSGTGNSNVAYTGFNSNQIAYPENYTTYPAINDYYGDYGYYDDNSFEDQFYNYQQQQKYTPWQGNSFGYYGL